MYGGTMKKFIFILLPAVFTLLTCMPVASASAGVITLRQINAKSDKDTKRECQLAELYFRVWRCEGWDGVGCHRQSLTQPNHIYCFQYFFMSSIVGKPKHMDCTRIKHYYAPNGKSPRGVRKGTTKWRCVIGKGAEPSVYSPANVASRRAVRRYLEVTRVTGTYHWKSKCSKQTTWKYWHCKSQVWKGGYKAYYNIYVKGNYSNIVNERYVR